MAKRLAREEGSTLLIALVFLLVMTTVAGSVFHFATANQSASARQRSVVSARALAEAGINNAASVLANASDPTVPTLLSSRTTPFTGGTATWSGTYDAANKLWNVTSTGTVIHTLQGNKQVSRTLTAKVPLIPSLTQTASLPGWNYVYATGSAYACDLQLQNSVALSAPSYVIGDLCLYNTAKINTGPVNVSGRTYLTQPSNYIGAANARVNEVHSVLGCQLQNKAVHNPCIAADQVFATVSNSTLTPAVLSAPVVDWDYWHRNASPGPFAPCQEKTGTPPTFDVGTPPVRDANLVSTASLAPAGASYTCKTKYGELSWNHVSKIMTIRGSIFIDGSATFDSVGAMTYTGQGTLFVSGQMTINGTQLCAALTSGVCNFSAWNPNATYMSIATNAKYFGFSTYYGIQLVSSGFQGGLYSTYTVDAGQTSDIDGGVIGSRIVLGQKANITAPTTVPAGHPGTAITSYMVGDVYGYGP